MAASRPFCLIKLVWSQASACLTVNVLHVFFIQHFDLADGPAVIVAAFACEKIGMRTGIPISRNSASMASMPA